MFRRKPRPKLAKKWEGDYTTIKKHYKHILIPMGGVALVGTLTAAIALPIMITKIAKEEATKAFEKIIPIGGKRRMFVQNEKINYLAIGDSVTAGYNGFMKADGTATGATKEGGAKEEYLSYADFLASDLNKNGMLGSYRNFAVSGYTIPQSRELLLRNQGNLKLLQNTDLITLSLGANDFLSAVQVLDIPFRSITSGLGNAAADPLVTQINTARNDLFNHFGLDQSGAENHYTNTANGYASRQGIAKLIRESFTKLIDMTKKGELSGLMDIQKDLYEKVYGLIQLDLATYINELHQAAPKAQIEVMGYAFPFHKLPVSLVNGIIVDKNTSMKEAFNKFIDTLDETTSKAQFVDFFDINKLKEFGPGSDLISYDIDQDNARSRGPNREWDRAMPNAFDIHPSTYGHGVIANHLFETLIEESGNKITPYQSITKLKDKHGLGNPAAVQLAKELESIYTFADLGSVDDETKTKIGYTDEPFEVKDERATDTHDSAVLLMSLLNSDSVVKMLSSILSDLIEPANLADHYADVFKALSTDVDTGKPYATTALKLEGIAKALKPVVKPGIPTDLVDHLSAAAPDIVSKIKNIALDIQKLVKGKIGTNDYGRFIDEFLTAISAADFSMMKGKTLKSSLEGIITAPKNEELVSDLLATFAYLATAPEDSELLKTFKSVVDNLSVEQNWNLAGNLGNISTVLITPCGIYLNAIKHNFDSGDTKTVRPFLDSIIAASKRLGFDLDENTLGQDEVTKLLKVFSGDDSLLDQALGRMGIKDKSYFQKLE